MIKMDSCAKGDDSMRIAIVDDCLDDRLDVALCLDQYMHAHHLTYTLTEFDNATSFLQLVPHVNFDVVFMDIYMPDMNDIDVAKKLRDRDKHCKIILMTITEDFARMGYGLAATYYLLKPVSDYPSDFEEAMALCQLKPPYDVATLAVTVGAQTYTLPTDQILYIDYQNRLTRIHTPERVIQVRESFQEVTAALTGDKRFLLCYRGILVNMDYIDAVEKLDFRLTNDETLPLAQRKGKQLKEAYRRYVFSKMGGLL